MTVKKVIEYVDGIKPNAFTNAQKVRWLNEVEGMVQTEVLLLAPAEVVAYAWNEESEDETSPADDRDTELLVYAPHDKLYGSYLTAMIDFANGEYDKYQNSMELFNAQWGEFMRWFALTYRPADTHGRYEDEQ